MDNIFEIFPDLRQLADNRFAGVSCAKPTIMIAMTARTGSTHLCAALQAAGDVGRPGEIFNPRGVAAVERERRGVELFADYMRSFAAEPSPVFIFKTSWQDFAPFAQDWRALFPNLRVVYLDRKNLTAQAVSLYRAQISGTWHQPAALARTQAGDLQHRFDLARICALMQELTNEKCAWEQFFGAEGLTPARLFYENFHNDVTQALRFLAQEMGLGLRADIPPGVGFDKLADALNHDWVERVQRHVLRMT
jgi:LPS sulfotransferase NodH